MKSLFNPSGLNEIIERINKLTPQSKPQWGKMNVAQMLAHCVGPLKMAHAEIPAKRGLISYILGPAAKKKYTTPGAILARNVPTDPNFKFPSASDFELEKSKLVAQIKLFSEKGPSAITEKPHSFFGKMTPQEWDILQVNHLNHHLTQFGV